MCDKILLAIRYLVIKLIAVRYLVKIYKGSIRKFLNTDNDASMNTIVVKK